MKWPFVSRERFEEMQRRAQIAEDRLYAAWKDGYTVPPRQSVEPKEPEVLRLLPPKIHAAIQNWESAETRDDLEREARRLHFDHGYSEDRVLAMWEAREGNGVE